MTMILAAHILRDRRGALRLVIKTTGGPLLIDVAGTRRAEADGKSALFALMVATGLEDLSDPLRLVGRTIARRTHPALAALVHCHEEAETAKDRRAVLARAKTVARGLTAATPAAVAVAAAELVEYHTPKRGRRPSAWHSHELLLQFKLAMASRSQDALLAREIRLLAGRLSRGQAGASTPDMGLQAPQKAA